MDQGGPKVGQKMPYASQNASIHWSILQNPLADGGVYKLPHPDMSLSGLLPRQLLFSYRTEAGGGVFFDVWVFGVDADAGGEVAWFYFY